MSSISIQESNWRHVQVDAFSSVLCPVSYRHFFWWITRSMYEPRKACSCLTSWVSIVSHIVILPMCTSPKMGSKLLALSSVSDVRLIELEFASVRSFGVAGPCTTSVCSCELHHRRWQTLSKGTAIGFTRPGIKAHGSSLRMYEEADFGL